MALLGGLAWLAGLGCARTPEGPPNIVLIVMDTVRADRLSCYGYPRPTTPWLDELCARGIVFENAVATSSWTLPSHASLFTGLAPSEHGATQEHTRLEAGPATLAELLHERGYTTLAASANPVVGSSTGLDRGFDRFVETWRGRRGEPDELGSGHPNLVAVADLLADTDAERPFFLFVNFIEAHGPYLPPEPLRSKFLEREASPEQVGAVLSRGLVEHYLARDPLPDSQRSLLSDLYDGEVAYVDVLVGSLVERLERGGWLENAVVLVTSDHGENLGDHGHLRHVFSLYRSTVRVPLIALLPGGERAGEVRPEPVSLTDLFTTVLARAGARPPAGQRTGRDILARPDPGGSASQRAVFAEYHYPLQVLERFPQEVVRAPGRALAPHLRRLRSVERDGLRLIWSSDGRHELYDLARDPGELRDLAGEPALAERRDALLALLDGHPARVAFERPLPGAAPEGDLAFRGVDDDARARLRELGYLR